MGGTDVPENLITLTIPEHAEAHRQLFLKYNKTEDKIAWLALSGMIGKEDIIEMKMKMGRENAGRVNKLSGHMSRLGKSMTPEYRKYVVQLSVAYGRKHKTGCFFDNELHKISASLGVKNKGE